MTCKRCEDIHTAQKAGLTQTECKCDCHNQGVGSIQWTNDLGGAIQCDCTDNVSTVSFTQGFPAQTCNCVGFGHQENCVIGIEESNANSAMNNTKSNNKKCNCDYRKGGHDKNCKVFD